MKKYQRGFAALLPALFAVVLALAAVGAWVTHVFNTIWAEQWVLLVVGAFIAPIGVIHGVGLWFGLF